MGFFSELFTWMSEDNPNAAPPHCDHLKQRAQKLMDAAREYFNPTLQKGEKP